MKRAATVLVSTILLAGGCETREAPPDTTMRRPAPAPVVRRPSAWRAVDGSMQLALPADEFEPALADAIATARRTAAAARDRWNAEPADARGAWGVKWRAATEDGGHEYVWVEPAAWSAFRIEGRLASPPQRPLACGRTQDELVSFPNDELADWVRYENPDFTGDVEGGYTTRALEEQHGKR